MWTKSSIENLGKQDPVLGEHPHSHGSYLQKPLEVLTVKIREKRPLASGKGRERAIILKSIQCLQFSETKVSPQGNFFLKVSSDLEEEQLDNLSPFLPFYLEWLRNSSEGHSPLIPAH